MSPCSLASRRVASLAAAVACLFCLAAAYAQAPATNPPLTAVLATNLVAPAPTAGSVPALSPNPSASAVTNTAVAPGTNLVTGTSMDNLDNAYRLQVGDRLSFRIVEDLEPAVALVISDTGDLEVPYIGRYRAIAKTCRQLAQELKTELEKEYYYQATVMVAVDQFSPTRGKIYLIGAVRVPGPQEIPGDETYTISKAIMRAGGFAEYGDGKKVKITRKRGAAASENLSFVINVMEIIEKGKTDADIQLEPGDLIYVPNKLFGL